MCDTRRYWIGIALSGAIVVVYLCGAALSGSLALTAEGGHALVDAVIAYGWAIFVDWCIYRRPETEARMRRLGSILNGIFFMMVGVIIVIELVRQDTQHINNLVLAVASTLGVLLNVAQYRVIGHGDEHETNVQLNIHNLGDILQGLAVIATSIAIALTGWEPIDRVVAGIMAAWFFYQGVGTIFPHKKKKPALDTPRHHHSHPH